MKDDGHRDPNLRVLVKPLLNLFHGDRGNKRWKNLIDAELKERKHKTLKELMDATLRVLPDEVLDAPPKPAADVAVALQDGREELPVWGIADVLPGAEDRSGGLESRRFWRSDSNGSVGVAAAAGGEAGAGSAAAGIAVVEDARQGEAGEHGQQQHGEEQQQQTEAVAEQQQVEEEPKVACHVGL